MGTYQKAEYYDEAYKKGTYDVDPEHISLHHYHLNWSAAIKVIHLLLNEGWRGYNPKKIENIVDLGCGPGHFAQMLNLDGINYHGYDFSNVAIEKATERLKGEKNKKFYVMDLEKDFPKHENVIYTSFEFFEHIPFDFDILNKLKKDDFIIFSVPSFDTESHVQYFPEQSDVTDRYSEFLRDLQIFYWAGGVTPEGINHTIYVVIGRKK
mgnify:CR=1 FL=1